MRTSWRAYRPDAQVVFVDTPGIHRPLHRMNVRMVDTAVDSIGEVDVVGVVVDASDRDAAWYETQGQDRWWDETNAALPNCGERREPG
jgi:GTPase Era involved in 16S rRNA processing